MTACGRPTNPCLAPPANNCAHQNGVPGWELGLSNSDQVRSTVGIREHGGCDAFARGAPTFFRFAAGRRPSAAQLGAGTLPGAPPTWLARNPAALGQHFPAIHGDSANSKGIADIPTIALVSADTVKTPQPHFSLLATGHRHELLQEPAGRPHTNTQNTLYF